MHLIPIKKQNEKKAKNKDCAMIHFDIVLNRNTLTEGLIGVLDFFSHANTMLLLISL